MVSASSATAAVATASSDDSAVTGLPFATIKSATANVSVSPTESSTLVPSETLTGGFFGSSAHAAIHKLIAMHNNIAAIKDKQTLNLFLIIFLLIKYLPQCGRQHSAKEYGIVVRCPSMTSLRLIPPYHTFPPHSGRPHNM